MNQFFLGVRELTLLPLKYEGLLKIGNVSKRERPKITFYTKNIYSLFATSFLWQNHGNCFYNLLFCKIIILGIKGSSINDVTFFKLFLRNIFDAMLNGNQYFVKKASILKGTVHKLQNDWTSKSRVAINTHINETRSTRRTSYLKNLVSDF